MENQFEKLDVAYKEALNSAYRSSEVRIPPYDLPRGAYITKIRRAYLQVSGDIPPRIGLVLEFVVLGGDYDGCLVRKYNAVRPESMGRIRSMFALLGVEFDGDVETMGSEEWLSQFEGLIVDVYAFPGKKLTKTGRAFINVTLRRLAGKMDSACVFDEDRF